MKITDEKREQIYELYRSKYKLSEIAKLFGVSQTTIAKVARKGIKEGKLEPRKPLTFGKTPHRTGKGKYVKKGTTNRKLTDEQEQALLIDYFENDYTVKMIKEKYNIWAATFHRIRKNAIDRGQYQPKGSGYHKHKKYEITKEQEQEIIIAYFENNKTRAQLAERYGVSISKIDTICGEARKKGLYLPKKTFPESTRKAIIEDYFVNGMTAVQVAKKYGVKKRTVANITSKELKKGVYEHKKTGRKLTDDEKLERKKQIKERGKKNEQGKLEKYHDLYVDYFENGMNSKQVIEKYNISSQALLSKIIALAIKNNLYRGKTTPRELSESEIDGILKDYFENDMRVEYICEKNNIKQSHVYKIINQAIAEGKYERKGSRSGRRKKVESLNGNNDISSES